MICAWSAWERSMHGRLLREPTVCIASVFRCICSVVTSPRGTDSALLLSSSEESECESAEAPPPVSPQYEELLEVMTHAVAKLNISWPSEEHAEPQTSKLDERFLRAKRSPPTRSLRSSPISTPRCRDHGQAHSRPTSSSPPLITTVMWGD